MWILMVLEFRSLGFRLQPDVDSNQLSALHMLRAQGVWMNVEIEFCCDRFLQLCVCGC